ncbi:PREDICTED: pre-mRNA 3'-end-processing factor FIP1 isoform X2 [Nicrophorus vespilloides]|uniref:Pre-mRNA 3'-end-processing factor FIP1 isoform X2 n=1 Tax=Nicrophorus vespilloides TaxID=110193 RepID=A0ABM1MT65_NICVS|nr:PREDICTED: pre-mRNA 3'-end-processing factor FIP1 isoform X2 [Nicrophorus vespilloides]
MADDAESDDQWLYGDTSDLPLIESEEKPDEKDETNEETEKEEAETSTEKEIVDDVKEPEPEPEVAEPAPPGIEDPEEEMEQEETDKQNGDQSDREDSDDDSDDDVNVVIGDIKTTTAYSTSLNIKRSGLLTSSTTDKTKIAQQQSGKFTVEEFDQVGMINGVPANEFNLDSLEDKPWRKPGADITDYFNYGFNEDTWKAYCERQKRIRVNESGVGLVPLNAIGLPRGPVPILNDNRGAAQPGAKMDAPKENVIQVMTADRREYSRKPPGFPDMSIPPPSTFDEFQPEFGFNPEPEPFYGGYEPTQDVQWGTNNQSWTPSEIKPLTGHPSIVPAPVPPVNLAPPMVPPVAKDGSPSRHDSREERESSRSRSEKPRDRERSHRRDRSRSRSRRHKSRSRSPSHRHRKKKSRRHDDSD